MMDEHDEFEELQHTVRLWRGIMNGIAITLVAVLVVLVTMLFMNAIARADEPLWITVDPNELTFDDTIYLQSCVMVDGTTVCIVKED